MPKCWYWYGMTALLSLSNTEEDAFSIVCMSSFFRAEVKMICRTLNADPLSVRGRSPLPFRKPRSRWQAEKRDLIRGAVQRSIADLKLRRFFRPRVTGGYSLTDGVGVTKGDIMEIFSKNRKQIYPIEGRPRLG